MLCRESWVQVIDVGVVGRVNTRPGSIRVFIYPGRVCTLVIHGRVSGYPDHGCSQDSP